MAKFYRPQGDEKQGYRIKIPAIVKRADLYRFEYLPDGILVYTPVITP